MKRATEPSTQIPVTEETAETEFADMTKEPTEEEPTEVSSALCSEEVTENTAPPKTQEDTAGADVVGSYTIEPFSNRLMYVQTAVNLRDQPSTGGTLIGVLPKGEEVTVTGRCRETNWYRIIYGGGTAYCSSSCLSTAKASTDLADNGTSSSSVSTGSSSSSGSSNSSSSSSSSGTSKYYTSSDLTESDWTTAAKKIVELTNAERKSYGLSSLTMDSLFLKAGAVRASEQILSFGHTRPNGTLFYTVGEEVGISSSYKYFLSGENVAMFSWPTNSSCTSKDEVIELIAQTMVDMWMDSEGHRSNIVNENYLCMGAGVAVSGNLIYAVQLFGY